jgi:hypothetical protein
MLTSEKKGTSSGLNTESKSDAVAGPIPESDSSIRIDIEFPSP